MAVLSIPGPLTIIPLTIVPEVMLVTVSVRLFSVPNHTAVLAVAVVVAELTFKLPPMILTSSVELNPLNTLPKSICNSPRIILLAVITPATNIPPVTPMPPLTINAPVLPELVSCPPLRII